MSSLITRALAAVLLLGFLLPATLTGQQVRVAAEQETFHQLPDGRRLATLMSQAPLTVADRQGRWLQVTLEGWIWSASVAPTSREGFQLVVSAAGGENLRAEAGGTIVARLLQGFLLERVEEGGQWTRVRRTGWVRASAVEVDDAAQAALAGSGGAGPSGPRPPGAGERFAVHTRPLALRHSPDGEPLGEVMPGGEVQVVERRNGWVRVRLDGWAPAGELVPVEEDAELTEVSAAALRANPEQYEGRRVRWTVQFISFERAEAERTDFYEGEPFLLARAPDRADGFVYLAVPPELLEEVGGLRALQSVDVLARVRTGRSALMGVPVLDLLALY